MICTVYFFAEAMTLMSISPPDAVRRAKTTKKVEPKTRRPGRPSASEPSGQELRELVIDAARSVYAEHGFHRSSVEQLLVAANISRPTFYRLFDDKREVFDELIGRLKAGLAESVTQAMASASSLHELIEYGLDAFFEWRNEDVAVIGALYREIHDLSSPASAHRDRTVAYLNEAFRKRAEALGYPKVDPLLYDALLHVTEYVGAMSFMNNQTSKAQIRRSRQVASRIMLAALMSGVDDRQIPPLPLLGAKKRPAGR